MVLARLKRRGEALRAYQRLASVLQKSFHALPSAETQALYEAVLRGDEMIMPPLLQIHHHHNHPSRRKRKMHQLSFYPEIPLRNADWTYPPESTGGARC